MSVDSWGQNHRVEIQYGIRYDVTIRLATFYLADLWVHNGVLSGTRCAVPLG